MTSFRLSPILVTTIVAASAAAALSGYLRGPAVTVQAQGKTEFAPGQQPSQPAVGAVGTWFGVARACPATATGDDADHAAFCQAVCGDCLSTPGTMPPELPMLPTIHADGTMTVNDAGSIPVFRTTAQGAWAPDPDPSQVQLPNNTRYQGTYMWMQGNGGNPGQFIGVGRPRFVTFWDPANPDNMIGYIQPHFYPIVGPSGLVDVLSSGFKGALNVTNHYPV